MIHPSDDAPKRSSSRSAGVGVNRAPIAYWLPRAAARPCFAGCRVPGGEPSSGRLRRWRGRRIGAQGFAVSSRSREASAVGSPRPHMGAALGSVDRPCLVGPRAGDRVPGRVLTRSRGFVARRHSVLRRRPRARRDVCARTCGRCDAGHARWTRRWHARRHWRARRERAGRGRGLRCRNRDACRVRQDSWTAALGAAAADAELAPARRHRHLPHLIPA
jgi:hypothetical protein